MSSPSPPQTPERFDPSLTDVFGAARARQLRWALWVRKQFTATSLTVIGLVVAGAWGYIAHIREQVSSLTTRVVVLETVVIPDQALKGRVSALELKDVDKEARLRNLEDNYDFAREHATDPPMRRRK